MNWLRLSPEKRRAKPENASSPPAALDSKSTNELASMVWEDHEDEEYRRDQSHWRGHGRWTDDERWLRIGRGTLNGIKEIERLVRRKVLAASPVVLEWGPGGGSNLLALSKLASKLYATDVSSKNLEESARVLREAGFSAFQPILLKSSLEQDLALVEEPIDVFISSAVFQHFPSKQYGLDVLATVRRRMADGGVGRIQLRFDNGNPRYRPKATTQYEKSHIRATSYGLDEFWDALKTAGFQPLSIVKLDGRNNYATFLFTTGT